MQDYQLQRSHALKKKKYIGRGGKRGTTSGKGTKGQRARSGRKLRPEIRDMIKKLPLLRGRGKHSLLSLEKKPAIVSLTLLATHFTEGETVSPVTLVGKGLVKKGRAGIPQVKILSGKLLTKKLAITGCVISASAKALVEKAGGTVTA